MWRSWLQSRQLAENTGNLFLYLENQLGNLRDSINHQPPSSSQPYGDRRNNRPNQPQQQSVHINQNALSEEPAFLSNTMGPSYGQPSTGPVPRQPSDHQREQQTFRCAKCRVDNHTLENCQKFQGLSTDDRLAEVRKLRVHYRCLQKHARGGPCPVPANKQKCPTNPACQHSHHALLHGAQSH